jgi:hypothetical protein
MNRPADFTPAIQRLALARQQNLCGSCGTFIRSLGNAGREDHEFGEGGQAHHIRHVKSGGLGDLGNCVVICQSCHYSAHEGGNYRHGTVVGTPSDFPYYKGKKR